MPGDERMECDGRRSVGVGTLLRVFLVLGSDYLVLAALMFLPAGIGWRKGWLFLAVLSVLTLLSVGHLWRTHPEAFVARSKIRAGTKLWDKVMLALLLVSAVAVFSVAGLDSRYHWSSVPLWLTAIGYVVFTFGFATFVWVLGVRCLSYTTQRWSQFWGKIDRYGFPVTA